MTKRAVATTAEAGETLTTGQMLDFFQAELDKTTGPNKLKLGKVQGDVCDRGKSSADQHDTLSMHNHRVAKINALSEALSMIRCGIWDGIHCHGCGDVIPFKRQKLAPSIYCVGCKSALEAAAKQKARR